MNRVVRTLSLFLFLLLFTVLCKTQTVSAMTSARVSQLGLDLKAKQVVCVESHGTTRAVVTMFRKTKNGNWKKIMKTRGYVGQGGVGTASEGSTVTPRGLYHFTKLFGTNYNPGTKCRYTQVNENHFWVDDPNSRYYNRFVDVTKVSKDWNSAENLSAITVEYAYAAAFDYNKECIPGLGSAFFLHCEAGKPTQGCISVPQDKMIFILLHLTRNSQIYIE